MNIVIYHANCLDGLAAAAIANACLTDAVCYPRNYNERLDIDFTADDNVYFVDFSASRNEICLIASIVNSVVILDHHATACSSLVDLPPNVEFVFNNDKSGCILTHDYFLHGESRPMLFDYIDDRDRWQWKLPSSKAINTLLQYLHVPHDLDRFYALLETFDIDNYATMGATLLEHFDAIDRQTIAKVSTVELLDTQFVAVNANSRQSEVGNLACEQYGKPALIYYIVQDEVHCSLRSLDTLPAINLIAKSYGGGGHRNAAGFTMPLKAFTTKILGVQP